jgi:hypothetical protein
MRPERRTRFESMLFHNLKPRAQDLNTAFAIDILEGVSAEEG